MPITFTCPHCGTTTDVADQFAGQTGPCKSCGNKVTVPHPHAVQAPSVRGSSTATMVILVIAITFFGLFVCGGGLVALLLPAVQAAREAARRQQCSNNLKQIGLALHNYQDVYKAFPPAYTVDANGKRLHSWRTLLLPYLEQDGLYRQIDLDEPWDSPRNLALSHEALPVYQCPTDPSGSCAYMAIVGENTVFSGSTGVSLHEITDGTSNTIAVVEVRNSNTSWMAPVDLDAKNAPFQINSDADHPGSHHPGGMNALFSDGAVRYLSEAISVQTFQDLTTRNDGRATPSF